MVVNNTKSKLAKRKVRIDPARGNSAGNRLDRPEGVGYSADSSKSVKKVEILAGAENRESPNGGRFGRIAFC